MASGTLNGHIQMWGGEGPAAPYPQGHDYDPRTNTWITIMDQPTPRETEAATIGDTVYVPAGAFTGYVASDEHEAFSFIITGTVIGCMQAGSDPVTTESDGDGYTDQDELDNRTDPCSPASVPPDADGDRVSDRIDPDDDNDGIPDTDDQFQLDPSNGSAAPLPWEQTWNADAGPAGEFANSGFPGVQLTTNGTGFIEELIRPGGAGGFMSVTATAGTSMGTVNTQDNALQVGFDGRVAVLISARIADPLSGQGTDAGKAGGIFLALDEDNMVRLDLATDNGTGASGLRFGIETAGTFVSVATVDLALPGPSSVDMFLFTDPVSGEVIARYRVDSSEAAAIETIGSVSTGEHPNLSSLFAVGAGAGIVTTNPTATSFALLFDYFRIDPLE
jgi:hypothetical protein